MGGCFRSGDARSRLDNELLSVMGRAFRSSLTARRQSAKYTKPGRKIKLNTGPDGRILGMSPQVVLVTGILRRGYGVSSGPSPDYPYGALERQIPIFKERGLDLSRLYRGTLNVDIAPCTFKLINPEYTFREVRWTDLHPPETFSFSRCHVKHADRQYAGWIYYPHPETKLRNFQSPSLLEIIAHYIPGLGAGVQLEIRVNSEQVEIQRPP